MKKKVPLEQLGRENVISTGVKMVRRVSWPLTKKGTGGKKDRIQTSYSRPAKILFV